LIPTRRFSNHVEPAQPNEADGRAHLGDQLDRARWPAVDRDRNTLFESDHEIARLGGRLLE